MFLQKKAGRLNRQARPSWTKAYFNV